MLHHFTLKKRLVPLLLCGALSISLVAAPFSAGSANAATASAGKAASSSGKAGVRTAAVTENPKATNRLGNPDTTLRFPYGKAGIFGPNLTSKTSAFVTAQNEIRTELNERYSYYYDYGDYESVDVKIDSLNIKSIQYYSDDSSIIKVGKTGSFKAVNPGKTDVYAYVVWEWNATITATPFQSENDWYSDEDEPAADSEGTGDGDTSLPETEITDDGSGTGSDSGSSGTGSSSDTGSGIDSGTHSQTPEPDIFKESSTTSRTLFFPVEVYVNMKNVKLAKTSFSVFVPSEKSTASYSKTNSVSTVIKGGAPFTFNAKDNDALTVTSSNKNVTVYGELKKNLLVLEYYGAGKTTVTANLYGKTFKVVLNCQRVAYSTDFVLLSPKKKKTLRLTGTKQKVTWKTSNKKIAAVSKTGVVTAKKKGNVLITAQVGNLKFGTVVSVVSKKKKKTVSAAYKLAKGKYSQPKRMKKGYYDCSSLVWRAYKPNGYAFGDKYYAPVAAEIAKYLSKKKKLMKGGFTYANVQKLKYLPGDLYFKIGTKDNKRFKKIYHVEMFTGYTIYYWDETGKPVYGPKWATKTGYYAMDGHLMGRP